jgi:hypothetical protein
MAIYLFDTILLFRKEELVNRAVLKYWLFWSCAFRRKKSRTSAFCIMTILFEKRCFGTKILILIIHCPLLIPFRVIFHFPEISTSSRAARLNWLDDTTYSRHWCQYCKASPINVTVHVSNVVILV